MEHGLKDYENERDYEIKLAVELYKEGIMKELTPKFLLSTVALYIGWFLLLGGTLSTGPKIITLGIQIVLGTWAYRLRKRERLQNETSCRITCGIKRVLQFACLIFVVCISIVPLVLSANPLILLVSPYTFTAVWVIIAYRYACKAHIAVDARKEE